jgi:hypothetical protein
MIIKDLVHMTLTVDVCSIKKIYMHQCCKNNKGLYMFATLLHL